MPNAFSLLYGAVAKKYSPMDHLNAEIMFGMGIRVAYTTLVPYQMFDPVVNRDICRAS